MSVTSYRVIGIGLFGDVDAPNLAYAAAQNLTSPGSIQVANLISGANTITVPSGATAVTLVPPAANAVAMTLKGLTGDTGVGIHLTDPTSLGLSSGVTSFVVTAASAITNFRMVWS